MYVAYKSGAHLNPAVTIGLFTAQEPFFSVTGPEGLVTATIEPTVGNMFLYFGAQMIGAFVGAVLAFLAYKKHFDEDAPGATKLAVFSTGPEIRSYAWNFVTEVIATFVLVFFVVASGKTPSGLGPLAVALIVVGIGASLGGPTGYAINPARDLGPRIAHAVLPIRARARATGPTPGSRSPVRWSAASSPACSGPPGSDRPGRPDLSPRDRGAGASPVTRPAPSGAGHYAATTPTPT